MAKGPHLLLVEARFYDDISDALFEGARLALDSANATYDRMIVPGALEIPYAIRMAAEASDEGSIQKPYDGYVALGCVIRGETSHYDHVCDEAAAGINRVQLDTGVPCAFGVITCETMEQALARADGSKRDQGRNAAIAAMKMAALKEAV